ncbi:MAG: glutamate--tRNA ligase [Bacilli bacterium]|nr:glutamate--tRNA ligase [Bacilli bacterium]
MTNKELADIMYPNVNKTIEDYELIYPERNLKEGAVVSRFAPSPTGFVHMGSLLTAFIENKFPKDTEGVFYLRIEDTDQKRSVENGIQGIVNDLNNFNIEISEGVISEDKQIGNYGPYIQSERKEIYETFAKYLVENDLAYPCFCSPEELEEIREVQEKKKERIGYYGRFAVCRNISNEEKAKKIKNKEAYVLRIKSRGDFEKKVPVNDLVRGKIEFPQNDIDHILIKNDGIPVYHFAHVIDDHLMRTTHVLRGEEWMPSTPLHIELFNMFGFKIPKYAHLGLVMKIDEDGSRRKLSKRKDPEAAVSYYHEKGIPVEAVKLYLMTIANSNFESWYDANPGKTIDDFKLDFKKMSVSGSLYDLEKLLNISKNYISKLSALEVYQNLYNWAKEFDLDFMNLIEKYKDFTISVLNIEREQKKPRKDYASYSEIKKQVWYMYDELFFNEELNYEFDKINDINEINKILDIYVKKIDINDDKETWFNKIKETCNELGYASDMKEYKAAPENYKGNVADISNVIRVALTTKAMTPDLYEIMKLFGLKRIEQRFNKIKEN